MYRNLRFDFAGRYARAFLEYAVLWLVLIPTFGLAYPFVRWRQSRYVVDNTRFGTTPFVFAAPIGGYYMIYLVPIALVLVLVLVGGFLVATLAPIVATLIADTTPDQQPPEFPVDLGKVFVLIALVPYLVIALIAIYIRARSRNLIFNTASLGEHRFRSNVSVAALLGLWITNTIALVCTLGLAWPWVRVRVARYYAACTTLLAAGNLDDFIARGRDESRAFAEEMGEVFGIDIGL